MLAFRSAALIVALAVLGGCSSGNAFVDRHEMDRSVKKQKLPGYDGQVTVCYEGDTPRAERDRLAAEACEVYGLKAVLVTERRWQCRMTAPHLASYYCFDPEMRMADGHLVNPFSNAQVKAWQTERRIRSPQGEE
ncbi:hypothetical protein [Paramagnetospirillum magneticum]|uniref:Lipoprotein n=1 Tax=Paramagnetospirillum magneticum (strain ATCC 700264 / AMB-1) TaxID=342108 RepID=Q2W067_PARM1|nr:hypothetical protein [Paramagnetospirillum magneticum]BAE52758.1 hypothetical protein amb3954 [Paramagnetospirillum magneticum AMB-1]